jgi:hypothetical protein
MPEMLACKLPSIRGSGRRANSGIQELNGTTMGAFLGHAKIMDKEDIIWQ